MLPEAATLRVAAGLISQFRSTKSMKIPLEILMCVAELAGPPRPPSPPLTVIQLLNINSVWQQTVGFKADGGFLQSGGVLFFLFFFPNAGNTFNWRGLHCLLRRS